MISTETDRKRVKELEGLYSGHLTDAEAEIFSRVIQDGMAYRDYNTPAGFFVGCAKVHCRY